MATVLDVGLISYFSPILPVLFTFALLFGILQKTKLVGESVGLNAIISAVVSLIILLSPSMLELVNFMIPWFVMAIIFLMLLLLLFKLFGADDKVISSLATNKMFVWAMIGIGIVILVASFSFVFGQDLMSQSATAGEVNTTAGAGTTEDFNINVWQIINNPKVLGMLIIFVIAIFAVVLLTGDN
jgi:hypothetical protein